VPSTVYSRKGPPHTRTASTEPPKPLVHPWAPRLTAERVVVTCPFITAKLHLAAGHSWRHAAAMAASDTRTTLAMAYITFWPSMIFRPRKRPTLMVPAVAGGWMAEAAASNAAREASMASAVRAMSRTATIPAAMAIAGEVRRAAATSGAKRGTVVPSGRSRVAEVTAARYASASKTEGKAGSGARAGTDSRAGSTAASGGRSSTVATGVASTETSGVASGVGSVVVVVVMAFLRRPMVFRPFPAPSAPFA
jgi:hypothetical protein